MIVFAGYDDLRGGFLSLRRFFKFAVFFALFGMCVSAPVFGQPNPIRMTDVSNGSGLDNELYGGPTRHSLGIVWLDFNDDGYPDVFTTNGYDDGDGDRRRPHLYMNDGQGGFDLSDNLLPDFPNYEYVGAVAADYDRDGDIDIFIYTAHEEWETDGVEGNPYAGPPNLLLKNSFVENDRELQDEMFEDVASAARVDGCSTRFEQLVRQAEPLSRYGCRQTRGAAFLDYDLDGWIDLYVAQMVINRASSDDPDADALGKFANTDVVFRNMGDGTFRPMPSVIRAGDATKRAALVARAMHLNDDIWPDMYVANVGGPTAAPEADLQDAILLNDGQGHLDLAHEYIGSDTPAAMGIAAGDVNGDGKFDVYLTDIPLHPSSNIDPNRIGNSLYISHEDGFSQNIARALRLEFTASWGTNFVDFDLDGFLDLFVGAIRPLSSKAPFSETSVIYSKLTSFAPDRLDLATTNVRGSSVADYDQDGDVDLILVNQDGRLQLFRNEAESSTNRSLTLNFQASRSNLDAIGLRAELITTDGKRLTQQVTGGNSTHSQDDTALTFGLGNSFVDQITIRWPHPDTPIQIIDTVSSGSITIDEPN